VLGRTVVLLYARPRALRAALGVSPAPLWFSWGLVSTLEFHRNVTRPHTSFIKGQGGGIAVTKIPRLGENAQLQYLAAPVTLNRKACVFQVIRILHYYTNHCH
jgi:hypothetical protein